MLIVQVSSDVTSHITEAFFFFSQQALHQHYSALGLILNQFGFVWSFLSAFLLFGWQSFSASLTVPADRPLALRTTCINFFFLIFFSWMCVFPAFVLCDFYCKYLSSNMFHILASEIKIKIYTPVGLWRLVLGLGDGLLLPHGEGFV